MMEPTATALKAFLERMADADYISIKDKLAMLQSSPVPLKVFGANSHEFQLNPPVTEAQLVEFETKYQVTLPLEYRGFLSKVGNGGAGPAYGLFKLGETDAGFGHRPWRDNDFLVGKLSEPFPHQEEWNDSDDCPEYDDDRAQEPGYEEEYQEQYETWRQEVYWSTAVVNGAIPICHLGCAYREWLVVTGNQAGFVWLDVRADQKGLRPVVVNNKPVTFLEWYKNWLEQAFHEMRFQCWQQFLLDRDS